MIRQPQPSHWALDKDVKACGACLDEFTVRKRKHHCRNCGQIFCADCTSRRLTLINLGLKVPSRICEGCYLELTNEDKRQIAEDLDAKDMMIDSLKRALHQKVLLLDEVKAILSQVVESSQRVQNKEAAYKGLPDLVDSKQEEDSDEEDEDESVEWHLKHLQQAFAQFMADWQQVEMKNQRLALIHEHLKEEISHRDVYIEKLRQDHATEVMSCKAELNKQLEINRLQTSIQVKHDTLEDDLETSAESFVASGSHFRLQRRSRSVCDMISTVVCWPISAMHGILHPSNTRRSAQSQVTPTLLGAPDAMGSDEELWQESRAHTPVQGGGCCPRRRARQTTHEPSTLNDRLL